MLGRRALVLARLLLLPIAASSVVAVNYSAVVVHSSCPGGATSGVCLHNAYPILRSFSCASPSSSNESSSGSSNATECATFCCGNCSATPACISWNINTQMKTCFMRGSWAPNPGKQCISGRVRAPPPPPSPPPPPLRSTYCNPVNLGYQFHGTCRAAADFTMVPHNGSYWLFTTDTWNGYWVSTDLIEWSLVASSGLPPHPVAPHAFVAKGTLYFTSIGQGFFATADPGGGIWHPVGGPRSRGDPMVLVLGRQTTGGGGDGDDSGSSGGESGSSQAAEQWLMFSGCSPSTPGELYGCTRAAVFCGH
jgi:hypothetical protein